MKTNTPRTDELYGKIWLFTNEQGADEALCEMRDFARELERENVRLREAAQALYNYECASGAKDAGEYERLFEALRVALLPNKN